MINSGDVATHSRCLVGREFETVHRGRAVPVHCGIEGGE